MRELSIEQVKLLELEVLKDIADFCEENGIEYFLCGGSLIGAVRHQGFIPWDDDIDIAMTRENYDKFVSLYRSDRYKLCVTDGDEDFYLPYLKVYDTHTFLKGITDFGGEMGVWVDIFPVDKLPADDAKRKKFVKKQIFRQYLIIAATARDIQDRKLSSKLVIYAMRVLKKLFGIKNIDLSRKCISEAKKYSNEETDKMGCVVWGYGMREVCPKEVFEKTVFAPFEHLNLRILEDYDTYLSNIYGDYMKFPPEEERVLKHGHNTFYVKEEYIEEIEAVLNK